LRPDESTVAGLGRTWRSRGLNVGWVWRPDHGVTNSAPWTVEDPPTGWLRLRHAARGRTSPHQPRHRPLLPVTSPNAVDHSHLPASAESLSTSSSPPPSSHGAPTWTPATVAKTPDPVNLAETGPQ